MALLNDIKRMQSEGKTEQEIISSLRQHGISPREIVEALSQSKIKGAVVGESPPEPYAAPTQQAQQSEQEALMPQASQETGYPGGIPATEQTIGYAPSQQTAAEQPMQYQQAQPAQQMQESYPEYQQYPQAAGISPDTITEIAEQVVSEKLSTLRKDMETIIDLKTTMGTKLSILDERLKRMEGIIDRLNLSIMQKVGDYMTNIDDIKKELIETQKSFKAMNPSLDSSKQKKQPQQAQQFSQE